MSTLRSRVAACLTPIEVFNLVCSFVQENGARFDQLSSFTPSVYDTAWVSMVRKRTSDKTTWLFPGSFQFVLQSQQEDGCWPSYASRVDGILNTLASILALLVHVHDTHAQPEEVASLQPRAEKACIGLNELLQNWSVEETDQVGFELLVPGLLQQLNQYGHHFDFPGRVRLMQLYEAKIQKIQPAMVYSKDATTLLHSLESLVGHIDFGNISHHCTERLGMLGSPAATAAYLIHSPHWDINAENYLRRVARESSDCGIPCAFPTCQFESSWALSTLLGLVLDLSDIDPKVVGSVSSYYENLLMEQSGTVGFVPGVLADADDTARTLLTMSRLGSSINATPLIEKFGSSSCFRTYEFERNPSFTTNCNVLLVLLSADRLEEDHSNLAKTTLEFLLSQWNAGLPIDKWNHSPFYALMLFCECLVLVLEKANEGALDYINHHLLHRDLVVVLCQVCSNIVCSQEPDGSWEHSEEVTAYCMIALTRCRTLPWDKDIDRNLAATCLKASTFLTGYTTDHFQPEYLWVEKVSYGSALLRHVYRQAAIHVRVKQHDWIERFHESFSVSPLFTRSLPLLTNSTLLRSARLENVGLALLEGNRLVECLKDRRTMIFPRDDLPLTKDDYLNFIPMIWTVCNHVRSQPLSPKVLWDMILLSMLNYQVDEYMETAIHQLPCMQLRPLLAHLRESCGLDSSYHSALSLQVEQMFRDRNESDDGPADSSDRGQRVLERYISYILHHESAEGLDAFDEQTLKRALYDFLLSHIAQDLDSRELKHRQSQHRENSIRPSHQSVIETGYLDWVRGSASDSTSCPFSFRFFQALLRMQGHSLPGNAQTIYLSQALGDHLATMCRMYNDCGSASRDLAEDNLNSLDFAEFKRQAELYSPMETSNGELVGDHLPRMKASLLNLADFERKCIEAAMGQLGEVVDDYRAMEAIRTFVDVTDLFGQIYVQKDIASLKK